MHLIYSHEEKKKTKRVKRELTKTKSQRFKMHSIRRNFAYWIECCNQQHQQQQHLN